MTVTPMSAEAAPPPCAEGNRRWFLIIGAILIAWFVLSEVVTETWYRWNESRVPLTSEWTLAWPTEEDAGRRGFSGFKTRELTVQERELLRYETADTASWRDASGNFWTAFRLQWPPDKRLNQSDVAHNPTLCLPSAGLKMVRELPNVEVPHNGQAIDFRAWEFKGGATPVFVYLAVRRVRAYPEALYVRDRLSRHLFGFTRTFQGNRGNPVDTLELIVAGPSDPKVAVDLLRREVSRLSSGN